MFGWHTLNTFQTIIIEQLSLKYCNYPKALATVLGVVGKKDWFSQSNSSFLGKENYFRRKRSSKNLPSHLHKEPQKVDLFSAGARK